VVLDNCGDLARLVDVNFFFALPGQFTLTISMVMASPDTEVKNEDRWWTRSFATLKVYPKQAPSSGRTRKFTAWPPAFIRSNDRGDKDHEKPCQAPMPTTVIKSIRSICVGVLSILLYLYKD
jgi:hypothetical protein